MKTPSMSRAASTLVEKTLLGVKSTAIPGSGPTSTVSVVIRGGSKFESASGAAHVLERFAFQNTAKRSGLRLTRETELMGGQLSHYHDRESIVLTAKFLRQDLPFFVELLGDVVGSPSLDDFELVETVWPLAILESRAADAVPSNTALELAHSVAFRKGLGNPRLVDPDSDHVSIENVRDHFAATYTKANIHIVGNDVDTEVFQQLVESAFGSIPEGTAVSAPTPAAFHGEARVKSTAGNAFTLAYPLIGADASPAAAVLGYALGGIPAIKWATSSASIPTGAAEVSPFVSTATGYASYANAGLLHFSVTGPYSAASSVSAAAKKAASVIKSAPSSLSDDVIKRAIAQAKFAAASAVDSYEGTNWAVGTKGLGLGSVDTAAFDKVTPDAVKAVAKKIAEATPAVAAVGKIFELPHTDEL
ncbi:hypothetical protein CANCADRAFT_79046 [Tortispora caseinolytica NRRL Y-17796]|uniref:Cytochrome b-c1 complex subunit 2, mitochondrial n=1 Tax=Tortispora caseinolytica NRRL Y-17796 TaxID=767744 RepID=A0A1E4TJK2_9ASCO|nr:hypothetical protein CANCADRAFT_79046 [Tortispora caseinolytica NRRL Y-17796]